MPAMNAIAALLLAAAACAVAEEQAKIYTQGDDIVIDSVGDVKIMSNGLHVEGKLMYRGENGTLMDAQAIEPRLQALNATTAAHTATLLAHETKLDAHEAAQAAQGGRLDTLDDTVAAQASDIQAAGERMDATEEATAAILLAGDNGLEIHTGAEDGGHVRIFADEIDLNGPVQVLDNDGQLVNINNLPSAVEELRAQMNGVVGELDATLTAAKEELRDLRSRCNGAYEYEVAPYTPTSDRLCRKLTTCTSGMFEARPPSPTTDRMCSTHKTCPQGTYEAEHATPFKDRVCEPHTECKASEYEVSPPSPFEDRVCAEAITCDPETTYKLQHHEGGDVVCIRLRECTQYEDEIVAPTETTDRICRVKQVTCTATQFILTPQTATRPRVCKELTVCNAVKQYQTKAPTMTSDRVCAVARECTASQYETAPLTATSDRTCKALTVCTAEEQEETAPTATSDRICVEKRKNGCHPDATYSYKINDDIWACMFSNAVSKSWTQVATACNIDGGYRLSGVKVMTQIGQPDEAAFMDARAYMANTGGSRYFVTGQPTRNCRWSSWQQEFNCNGLGYIVAYQDSFDSTNWGLATDGNDNELRYWSHAQTAQFGGTLSSLCFYGGDVEATSWANGLMWR